MKKLIHFVIVLLFVGYQNSKAQTDIFHDSRVAAVLKQAAAGDPDLLLFGRKSAGNYVNMAVLDKKHHTLSWFTCYGQQYDVVQLLDNQYEAVLSKKVEPFDLCKHFYLENLAFTEDAESQFRQLGNAALADTSRNRQAVYNYPQVKAAASTLQKVMAMESLLKKYSLQLYLLDAKSPHHLRHNDSLTLREPLAGRMIRRGDTTTYYNAYPLSAATRIVLCQKTPERMFVYDSRAQLIDSVPLKPGKFAALLKTQEDVFLLYRGWLELQSQQIMYDKLETAERLNRRDTGLYTQAYLLDNEDQLSRALLELQAQQLIIERKISRLLLPEDRMVDHILREHYTNAGPEISYAPGIGFAYTVNYVRGQKNYELGEHRGNVMAVVSDKKNAIDGNTDGVIDYYVADVINANDYYPFGSLMPGRTNNNDKKYRYGFNGKENDDEVKGEGNQQDYGMRIYDPRIGRFLSTDPLTKSFPQLTPYQYSENQPIWAIDMDGLERYIVTNWYTKEGDLVKVTIKGIRARDTKRMVDLDFKQANGGDLTNKDVYTRYLYLNGKQKSPSTSKAGLSDDEKKIFSGAKRSGANGSDLINYNFSDQFGSGRVVSMDFDEDKFQYIEAEALFDKAPAASRSTPSSQAIVLPAGPKTKSFDGSSEKGAFNKGDIFWDNARSVASWLVKNPNNKLEISVDGLMEREQPSSSWSDLIPGSKNLFDWNGATYGERVDNLLKEFRNAVGSILDDSYKNKSAGDRLTLKRGALNGRSDHYVVK